MVNTNRSIILVHSQIMTDTNTRKLYLPLGTSEELNNKLPEQIGIFKLANTFSLIKPTRANTKKSRDVFNLF